MSSNEYYGGINRRFEKRAAILRRAGFTYRQACPGVAVFTRTRYTRETNIAAATLLHADNRVWVDLLAVTLRRYSCVA